jgi:hypothetical protein
MAVAVAVEATVEQEQELEALEAVEMEDEEVVQPPHLPQVEPIPVVVVVQAELLMVATKEKRVDQV